MPHTDPRVDAFIAKSAVFAQPILRHVRDVVHEACPDLRETIKWGFVAFEYHGLLCSMSAFKAHAAFGFWKEKLLIDEPSAVGMGSFGKLTSIDDLPDREVLIALIRRAMQLNVDDVKTPGRGANRVAKPPSEMPPDLAEKLAVDAVAAACFRAFPAGQRREYIDWLNEAKRAETREKRLAQAIEWIAQGKSRNWKYQNC